MAKRQGVRVQIVLDEDAYRLLGSLTSPHRKGEYLSDLIRRAAVAEIVEHPEEHPDGHPEGIQLLQSIEERLERIEDKLDAVAGHTEQPLRPFKPLCTRSKS
jgi:hypothetical protein